MLKPVFDELEGIVEFPRPVHNSEHDLSSEKVSAQARRRMRLSESNSARSVSCSGRIKEEIISVTQIFPLGNIALYYSVPFLFSPNPQTIRLRNYSRIRRATKERVRIKIELNQVL